MNSLKLKETMNQIHMNQEMQEEIIQNVKHHVTHTQHKKGYLKAAVAAAAFILFFGASVQIQASIRDFVKNRLGNIPKEELAAMNQMLQTQDDVQADQFSREYSSEEKIRLKQLEESYQHGIFPKQPITQTTGSETVSEDSLSYDTKTGTFYLPERSLTDEELLQIIDFKYASDYALELGDAAQAAKKAQTSKGQNLKDILEKEDGISEQEAEKTAEFYLKQKFNLTAENMDIQIFLDEMPDHLSVYHVTYQKEDDTAFYSYCIDLSAKDGSLVDTSYASLPKEPYNK